MGRAASRLRSPAHDRGPVAGVQAVEERVGGDGLAPVLTEALADAIRVLTGLQAELAANIAAASWSRGRAPGPALVGPRETSCGHVAHAIVQHGQRGGMRSTERRQSAGAVRRDATS